MDNTVHTKPYVIGVSGGSGSGKTSFVNDLIKNAPPNRVSKLTMDNYYHGREMQHTDAAGIKNFDLPQSIDLSGFAADLKLLIAGQQVKRMEYTFNNEQAVSSEIIIDPAPILIIEGLFIYSAKEISDLIDLKIIVNVKDVVKVIRRIKRDKVDRNYPVEDVLYRYEHHVLPSFEKYISPYMDSVDLIVNNNDNYDEALALIGNHILVKVRG